MNRRTNQRPNRYFAGKPTGNEEESESEEEEEEDLNHEKRDHGGTLKLDLRGVKVEDQKEETPENRHEDAKQRTEIAENNEDKSRIIDKSTFQSGKLVESGSNDDTDDSGSEENSEGDSEDSDSSADQITLSRPKFIPKNKRTAQVVLAERETTKASEDILSSKTDKTSETTSSITSQSNTSDSRKKQTLEMIEQAIKQEQKQRFLQRTSTTSLADEEVLAIDDRDGLDPEREYEEWKIRERARMKRDRQLIIEEEKRQEEAEEMRTMTEAERQKLYEERRRSDQDEKTELHSKNGSYHRGAFYQDDELVSSRDFNEANEDDYKNKEAIPTSLLHLNKIGKKGQSKRTGQFNSKRGHGWT